MTVVHSSMLLAVSGWLLSLASAVQPKELEEWFASSTGLAMSRTDAETLANKEWQTLTQCGVTVPALQALKDVMYNHAGMDLDMATLRKEILPLAEQHVSPKKLNTMYLALSSGYTISGGLALPKAEAQTRAVQMLKLRAEPDDLYALYRAMYGYGGLGFDQKTAQQVSLQLTLAGADAAAFTEAYSKAKAGGASQPKAVKDAGDIAVPKNLDGLVRRYAKDAQPYTAHEFQGYYQDGWLGEWLDAPIEMHVSSDRLARTASQFSRHYGSGWADKYRGSEEAVQVRLAGDGKAYTMKEFQDYYHDQWQTEWASSPELACKQCAPYAAAETVPAATSRTWLLV